MFSLAPILCFINCLSHLPHSLPHEAALTIRVAIYARHSTDKQSHSTRDQVFRCIKYCEKADYKVVHIFQDEAISGASVINRPGVSDLVDASLDGHFDRVVSEDLSRISRDQGDIANFFRKMCYLDIALETVLEGEINELHIGLKGTMNALFLKDLADKTRRGMIASVLKGSIPGGNTYGYDIIYRQDARQEPIKGLRRVNHEQAKVINWIFSQYAGGSTLKQICTGLNRQHIPAPKGGAWGNTTLIGQDARKTGLLRQTLYKGVVTFNRMMYRKNPDTGRRQSFMRPESEWVYVPVPELSIIDETLFNRVQELIEQRSSLRHQKRLLNLVLDHSEKPQVDEKRFRPRYQRPLQHRKINLYIFSGKLRCAEHDTKISVIRKRLYSCSERPCTHRYVKHENLMHSSLDAMRTMSTNQIKAAIKAQRHARDDLEAVILTKEAELETARNKMRNIFDALAERPMTPESAAYLDEREAQILKVKLEIDKLKKQHAPIARLPDDEAENVLNAFHKAIAPLHVDPDNQKVIANVFDWFNRFTMSTDMAITIDYNWSKLLSDLR